MRALRNWLRYRLNYPVLLELKALQHEAWMEATREAAWDGTPANLVARYNTLAEAVEIVRKDR